MSTTQMPGSVAAFLNGHRFAVAGVSRKGDVAANAVFKKLQRCGFSVVPVNPVATHVEGQKCYPSVSAIPGTLDGVIIATHPAVCADVVRECAEKGISKVWIHRSFGGGSVSDEAVRACRSLGIECIVGGCPLMFCEPVDLGHRCMRWWLQRRGTVPK